MTRTGYHGTQVDGREPGRFEAAGLIVTSWLQGTSRDGDPQDHVHNQIARITRTFSDGKWRALDTMSVRGVLGALQAVAATTVECGLTAEFSVAWIPRTDGARQRDPRRDAGADGRLLHPDRAGAREGTRTGAGVGSHHGGRAPTGPPTREAQERALAKALVLVSAKHPAWTRHDLVKQLALLMPPETRQMTPQAAQELLLGLADEALSGRTGEVACLEASEWPPLPASLRRQLDGRSVYTRPGAVRYATTAQLTLEDRLVAHAQTQGAPRLTGDLAARRLGADQAVLEAELRGRGHDTREHAAARGLRLDQAAAVWHVLTSARTVEIVIGPAGTGKTWVLATAASVWDGPVFGTATSQNATNELRAAGVQVAANTTRLLTDLTEGRVPPGSLILADEGSMISMTHLAALTEYAARNSCKLVLAGDQEQLAAVEGGGAMTLLADRLGYVQLAEPVRFTAEWERGASLRLRQGDATALDEYDQHGRIRAPRPTRPWIRPSAPTWPVTWTAGMCC